jgi:hypothetical protein
MKNFYVYAYFCPDTGAMLYVGKGKDKRAWYHLYAARENKRHSSNRHWHYKLLSIIQQGKEPRIILLNEQLSCEDALSIETSLILKYGRRDYDPDGILYNVCIEANDWTGLTHTQEAKDKIGAAQLGSTHTPEHIEKCRQASIGTKHPPRSKEWQQLQRESHVGRKDPNNPNRSLAHSGANNPRAKTWNLEREDGSTFQVVALKSWCKENDYNCEMIMRSAKTGKFSSGLRLLVA